MKKLLTLAIILTISGAVYAQVGVVNADSLRLGNPAGTGGVALFGKTYLKNITPGSQHDSILVRNANGSIRMVPRSVLFAAFATAADLSSYQSLANLSSDLTPSAAKYPSVNAVNAGLNLKANADGSNATGTWGISTTGNAATATSAAQWGTQTFNGSTFITPTQLMGYTGTTWGPVSQSGLQGFLGLGSNAYNSTAYLPLAGGTLTGGLTGTTALFNGNVGIGGADMYNKLNVVGTGTTNSTGGLLVQNSAGKTGLQVLDDLSVQIGHRLFGYSPSQHVRLNFIETDGGNMYIGRDNNSGSTGYPWTTINIGGWGHQNGYGLSVSTGVTVSNNQLVVSQAAASSAVGYSGGSFRITRNQNTNNFAFGIDGSDKAYIQYYLGGNYADILLNPQGGNIGIGKSNPAEALDVNGKALVSSAPTDPTGVVRKQDLEAAVAAIDLSDYLPLAGGTLSGALSGTSAGFSGNVTANSFTGAGTGLTGTASGLNIGGNAATVTNGVYTTGNQSVSGIKQFQSDGYFLSNLYVNPPAYSGGTRRFLSYSTSSGLVEHNGTADMQAFLGITGGPFLPLAAGSGNTLTGDLFFNASKAIVFNTAATQLYESAGTLNFRTNSSDRYIIDASGNNTWTGTGAFGGFVQTNNRFYAVGNTPSSNWISDALTSGYNQAGGYAWLTSASALQFGSGGTIRYTIDASGNNTWTGSGIFENRTRVFGGGIVDLSGGGNNTGISFGASGVFPINSSGYAVKDLGSASNPWGSAYFSDSGTFGGNIMVQGVARAGVWSESAGYALFGHKDFNTSAGYALMQNASGSTLLNGVGTTYIRVNGSDGLILTPTTLTSHVAYNGTSAAFSGNVTAASFIRSGGTSSQFLKADGSVDNSTYLTSSALGNYLPLSGGTLSGALSGTDAEFSGKGRFKGWSAGGTGEAAEVGISTGIAYLIGYNRTSSAYIPLALEGNGISVYSSSTINLNSGNNTISVTGHIRPATTGTYELGASSLRWDAIYAKDINLSAGLAASGNVTANSLIKAGGTSSQFLKADGSVDNNSYLTSSSLGNYLPLAGGTLSGSISGTSASFSGNVSGANLNISNWNTAYGWGNHAGAGYMTASSTNTLTNKSGNISQWTNDSGYITSSGSVNNLSLNSLGNATMSQDFNTGIYRNENGNGGNLSYSPVLHVNGGDTGWQLQAQYGTSSNQLIFRGEYNGSFGPWQSVYNSGNIPQVKTDLGLGSAAYLNANASSGANTVVQRDASGYIHNSYFNTSSGGAERNSSGLGYIAGFNSSDYYVRSYTPAALASAMGLGSNAYSSASYLPLSGGTLSGSLSGTSSSFSGDVAASTFSGNVASNYLNKQGNSYYQANTWIQLNGAYGLYAPSYNGAHFYPNSDSSYGAWVTAGSKGSYSGIYDAYSGATYGMFDAAGNGGAYDGATGWHYYWNKTTQSLGIGGSSTQSGYRATVNGALYTAGAGYFTGTVTAPTFSGALSGNASTATYATSAGSANSVAWGNVSGAPAIPTNTNQLSNGAGYITGDYTQSGLEAVMQRWSSTPYNMSIGKGASEAEGVGSAVTFASDYTGSPTYAQMWQLGGSGDMLNIGYNSGWNINLRIKKNGDLEARGNVTALSDARLKANIQELGMVSDALRNIRSVEYDRVDNNTHQVGFIAQEVQKYFPALVHTGIDERKTLSMAYQNFTAPLLKGWQEHDTVIQQQTVQIKQQDERIAQLERELAGLKEMIKRAEK